MCFHFDDVKLRNPNLQHQRHVEAAKREGHIRRLPPQRPVPNNEKYSSECVFIDTFDQRQSAYGLIFGIQATGALKRDGSIRRLPPRKL